MFISKLWVKNFRNLKETFLSLSPGINLFQGRNAQGKTNLLEAVCFLSTQKSFRGAKPIDAIAWQGPEQFFISAEISHGSNSKKLALSYRRGANLFWKSREIGSLRVITFVPHDLALFIENPERRRQYINHWLGSTDSVYAASLIKYRAILRQRNQLLKNIHERRSKNWELDYWDEQLSIEGGKILQARQELLTYINSRLPDTILQLSFRRELMNKKFVLKSTDADVNQDDYYRALRKRLKNNLRNDLWQKTTTSGPHRQDFVFQSGGMNFRTIASRGQMRALILALKLLEKEYSENIWKTRPVVILDDVLSEFDASRKAEVLDSLGDGQTLISGAENGPLGKIEKYFKVEAGEINETS